MQYELREIDDSLRPQCLEIFNGIILEGESYPWDEPLTKEAFDAQYPAEEHIWCAVENEESEGGQSSQDKPSNVLGFVHIHPNGIGRVSHIANCGYAVAEQARGKGVGRALVGKSIEVAKGLGFKGIQFNAVVATNTRAIRLYESFGFKTIGVIPCGFRFGGYESPEYVDRLVMYLEL